MTYRPQFVLTLLAVTLLGAAPETGGTAKPTEAPKGTPRMPSAPPREGPIRRDDRAEQVLKAAIDAQGGRDSIAGRQTIYIRYSIKNYDYPEPENGTITTWFKRPLRIRQEITYPHKKEIRACDGERAWIDSGKGPSLLGPLAARMIERGIRELDSPLLYSEGNLSYLSLTKDPRGRMTQKLSWHHEGYARDIMVDMATSRVLVIGEFDTPAGAISRMKVYDDYRPVQGMWLPFHLETFRNDQLYSVTDVIEAKFNLPVDDALFAFPGSDGSASGGTGTAAPNPR